MVRQMGDRVDRDTYNQINAHAKKLGSWYSLTRSVAPCRLSVQDEAKATEFRGWLTGQGLPVQPVCRGSPTEVTDPDQDNSKSKAGRDPAHPMPRHCVTRPPPHSMPSARRTPTSA